MCYKLKTLFVLFFVSFVSFAQGDDSYEIHLGLGRHQKNIDEYGNSLPYGQEIDKDILYIDKKELDYILKRSTYDNGILNGSFNVNGVIRWNGELVNTTWTLMSNNYHLMIQSLDDFKRYYYNIPVSELKDKVKRKY